MFSDAALRDVTVVQRISSGSGRSSGSARRKLLSSFALTRSFADESSAGNKHLMATTRCSSLPANSRTSLTGVESTGSVTNRGLASSAGSSHGFAPMSRELQPLASSTAGPSIQLAEILAAGADTKPDVGPAMNHPRVARDAQFAEAVGKLKLIPLSLPGDDPRLQQLNSVSALFVSCSI
jgi:hypothetical protein